MTVLGNKGFDDKGDGGDAILIIMTRSYRSIVDYLMLSTLSNTRYNKPIASRCQLRKVSAEGLILWNMVLQEATIMY
jgi:hypothetical protein